MAISRAKEVVRDLEAEAQHQVMKIWTGMMMMMTPSIMDLMIMIMTGLLTIFIWYET